MASSDHPSHVFNTDFCLRLAKHVDLEEIAKGMNLVFSPLSMYVVLSMIAAGSKGCMLEQMLSFLKVESIEELNMISPQLVHLMTNGGAATTGPELSLVNGVWVEQLFPLKPAFKDVMNSVYKAEARAVDFQNQQRSYLWTWLGNNVHFADVPLLAWSEGDMFYSYQSTYEIMSGLLASPTQTEVRG
ncbi:hypothetical protein ACLOJK_038749 [Asimina triloba]